MDIRSRLWRRRRICVCFFCVFMMLLFSLYAKNSVSITDPIFGVKARSRAQLRTHSVTEKLPGAVSADQNRPIPVLPALNNTDEDKTKDGAKNLLGPNKTFLGQIWDSEMSINKLSSRLKKAAQHYQIKNPHGVNVPVQDKVSYQILTGPQLLCQLKEKVEVSTLTQDLQPFSSQPWATQLPTQNIVSEVGPYKTCAVVSSAGAMRNSSLGKEIDSHDAVIRFNAAPTVGFENDVGSKTTLRIINSQVVMSDQFLSSSLYNSGILVAWWSGPFSADLHQWFNRTGSQSVFSQFQRYRRLRPLQPFYIVHPRFEWQLWQRIQDNMSEQIQKNPPSSGMLGTILMMSLCEVVHVYEFLPSKRKTDLCYYYKGYYDEACTMGRFHPLLYEKNLVKRMNQGSDQDIFHLGRVTLPGFSALNCTQDPQGEHH